MYFVEFVIGHTCSQGFTFPSLAFGCYLWTIRVVVEPSARGQKRVWKYYVRHADLLFPIQCNLLFQQNLPLRDFEAAQPTIPRMSRSSYTKISSRFDRNWFKSICNFLFQSKLTAHKWKFLNFASSNQISNIALGDRYEQDAIKIKYFIGILFSYTRCN